MIAQLRGVVVRREADRVVVDVHGVGYLVYFSASADVPAQGETVELYTSLQVREESMTLYGFTDHASYTMFELLLTSSGVGPRLALAALGTLTADVLRSAIVAGDVTTLTTIPGIGKKVAERLVLELKDKLGSLPASYPTVEAAGAPGVAAHGDVHQALVGLGYSDAEARRVLADLGDQDDIATEQLLRLALRRLASVEIAERAR